MVVLCVVVMCLVFYVMVWSMAFVCAGAVDAESLGWGCLVLFALVL